LPRGLAEELAPLMDRGMPIKAAKAAIAGCTITITYEVPQ